MSSWIVNNIEMNDGKTIAVVNSTDSLEYLQSLTPAGQMLVDSDALSFVYILEETEKFAHLIFSKISWGYLNKARKDKEAIYVEFLTETDKLRIELTNFWEELDYLLDNISGNANYGEKMVTKVESSFNLK